MEWEVIDFLATGILPRGDRQLFHALVHALLDRDEYMLLADYQSYVEPQEEPCSGSRLPCCSRSSRHTSRAQSRTRSIHPSRCSTATAPLATGSKGRGTDRR